MSLIHAQDVVFESAPKLDSDLVEIFNALEQAGIEYCMLRGYDLLWFQGTKEIDLLVLPEHLPALVRLLKSRGFISIPAWGHAPHRFFVCYNPSNDSWLKLDVIDAVRFGDPVRSLDMDITRDVLRHRCRRTYAYLPAPPEEFLKLLLHCILHAREFSPEKSRRLQELATEIANDPEVSSRLSYHVTNFLSPSITNSMLNVMRKTGGYAPLLNLRRQVIRKLFWAAPLGNTWRYSWTKLQRIFRPALIFLLRRGMTIALLAPDGAGKTTLARNLAEDPYIKAQVIYMGRSRGSQSTNLHIADWLRRNFPQYFGDNPAADRPFLFRALNYFLSLTEHWYRLALGIYHKLRGRFVVFDRYMYDSWLNPQQKQKPFHDRIFEIAWPNVDMAVVLDAPGRVLYERKREHSPEFLEQQRRKYMLMKERIPNVSFVNAARTEAEIKQQVSFLIWNEYASREK